SSTGRLPGGSAPSTPSSLTFSLTVDAETSPWDMLAIDERRFHGPNRPSVGLAGELRDSAGVRGSIAVGRPVLPERRTRSADRRAETHRRRHPGHPRRRLPEAGPEQ